MRRFLSWLRSSQLSQGTPNTTSLALPLAPAVKLQSGSFTIAVILHLYYLELATEIAEYLSNIRCPFDLYISTDTPEKESALRQHLWSDMVQKIDIRVVPNRGRDIAPKLITFADIYVKYDVALFIHTKRSAHQSDLAGWRKFILSQLIGTEVIVENILGLFSTFPDLGIIAPKHFEPIFSDIRWGVNWKGAKQLADRLDIEVQERVPIDFPSGSMFWVRPAALLPLVRLNLSFEDFEPELGQKDGTLAHQLERFFLFACEKAGYRWLKVAQPQLFKDRSMIVHALSREDCKRILCSVLLKSHAG